MIFQNCKQILFKWVLETGFMQDICFHTDDFSIDDFFLNLLRQMQSIGNLPHLTSLRDENLVEVLRIFTSHSHISNGGAHVLSPVEYSYLYFLLLHFSYVKYTKTFCGKLSKKLSLASQADIMKFMTQLYYCPSVTRQVIRNAIIAITYANLSVRGLYVNRMDLQTESFEYFELPAQKFDLTTHRLKCKLYNFKADLTASRNNSDFSMIKDTENYNENPLLAFMKYPNKSSLDDEANKQVRKQLLKDIFQREKNIFKHSDVIKMLKEEKCLIQNKLNYGENQVTICMQNFRKLDSKLTEIREELKLKDETIKYLLDKKYKLEQILTKVLSLSNCSGLDPKMCADLGAPNTEIENLNLKKELQTLHLQNTKLIKHMQCLVKNYTQEWVTNVSYLRVTTNEENEHETLTESFERFTNYVDKLNNLYKKEKLKTKLLQQDIFEMENRNETLSSRTLLFEKEIEEINGYVKDIENMHQMNKMNLAELENNKSYIKALVEENKALSAQLCSVKDEYEESKLNTDTTEQNFVAIIGSLQKSLEEFQVLNAQLIHENKELQRNIDVLNDRFKFDRTESTDKHLMTRINTSEKSLQVLQCSNKELADKNMQLRITCDKLNTELKLKSTEYQRNFEIILKRLSQQSVEIEECRTGKKNIRDDYEKLLVQYEDIKRELRKSDKQLEVMRNDCALKDQRELNLKAEIDAIRSKNVALRAKINKISDKQKHEKKTADLTIKRKEKQIKELQNEKEQFEDLLQMVQQEHDIIQKQMKKFNKQSRDFYNEVESVWNMLKLQVDDNHFKKLFYQETDSRERAMDPESKCILYNYLAGIKQILQELLDYKTTTVEKIKDMEFKQNETAAQAKEFKEKLQFVIHDREEILQNYENMLLECKKEFSFSADKVKGYDCKLRDLQLDKKMFLEVMEKELHGKTLDTLAHLTDQKVKAQAELKEKLNRYENKVQLLLQKYSNLGADIDKFKTSQIELCAQLSIHIAYRRELDVKLLNSENQCKELERKLKCTYVNECITQIENLKANTVWQAKQMEELKRDLEAVSAQKEIALTKSEIATTQLHREQEEKTVMLNSLESTTDQLKLSTEHIDALEKLCIELRGKLSESTKVNEQLQNDAAAKENDLRTQSEQFARLESEHSDMQNRIFALMQKVTELTEKLESNNTELISIMDILEVKFATFEKAAEFQDIFEVNLDKEDTTHFDELKLTLNKMMKQISKLKIDANERKDAIEYMEVLEKYNTELEKKLTQNKAKNYVLQETLASETQSKKKNIEKLHENLFTENEVLKKKLSKYEEEIFDLKMEVRKLFEKQKLQGNSEHLNMELIKNLTVKEKKLKEKLKSKQSMCNELQELCKMQERDVNEKLSIIHNLQKEVDETAEQNCRLRSKMEKIQYEMSLNDNNIKVLNAKCRTLLESDTCPNENDLILQSGASVGLQAKIIQLACVRNNITKLICVYKRHMRNARRNSK